MNLIQFITANWAVIASALFAISELLALIPGLKANSILQLVQAWLQKAINAAKR